MRKLSKMVLLSAAVIAPLFAVGCGDDDGSDNPSGGGTSTAGGEGGSSGSGGKAGGGSGGKAGSGGTSGSGVGGDPMGGGGGGGPEPFACDWDALEDGGAIPVDGDGAISEDTTLESGKSYTFDGSTSVLEGVTLTIQPCVEIKGESPDAVLGILPGAKIEAAGLPDAPIVFTSAAAPGARAPGDWGGLIIMGNALVNQPMPLVEGLIAATPYGSDTDENNDESSGTLQYVRVEFVGRDLGMDSESNGITFAGVGSGTVVDHIMVSNSIDDCFEWFGGAVSAHHLIALNCDDDMFDTDYAFSGSIQYAFGRQFESSLEKDSNGFEMDTGQNENVDPRTTAQWANVTLCGANTGEAPTLPRIGMVLRRQVSGSITNAIVTGFDSGAFSIRDTALVPPTDTTLTSSAIFGNLGVYGPSHSGAADWFEAETSNETLEEAPAGFDCYSNPPAPIPDEDLAGVDPGGDFEAAEYKGAFKAGENWMTGLWVTWAED